jgi:hypothetical protein
VRFCRQMSPQPPRVQRSFRISRLEVTTFSKVFLFFPTCVFESAAYPKLKTAFSGVNFIWNIGCAKYLVPHTSLSLTSLER